MSRPTSCMLALRLLFIYGAFTLFGQISQSVQLICLAFHILAPSLSLATTQEISVDFFSSRYLDVSVPKVCLLNLFYSAQYVETSLDGFPHSDTSGSMLVASSPKLFAGCHVFLRLLLPRHPPYALSSLDHVTLSCLKITLLLLENAQCTSLSFIFLLMNFYTIRYIKHVYSKPVSSTLLLPWSQSGSNRRPPACKAGALPAELWPLHPLGLGGLEPPTPRLSSVCSNQLSYRPLPSQHLAAQVLIYKTRPASLDAPFSASILPLFRKSDLCAALTKRPLYFTLLL